MFDIPIPGWLFKSKSRTREKTNLYVFLTPQIIRNQADARAVTRSRRDSLGEIEEGIIKLNEKNVLKKENGKSKKNWSKYPTSISIEYLISPKSF